MLITLVMAGKDKEILCDRGSRAYLSVKSAAEERIKVVVLLRRVAGKFKTIKIVCKIRQKSRVTRPIRNTNKFKENWNSKVM